MLLEGKSHTFFIICNQGVYWSSASSIVFWDALIFICDYFGKSCCMSIWYSWVKVSFNTLLYRNCLFLFFIFGLVHYGKNNIEKVVRDSNINFFFGNQHHDLCVWYFGKVFILWYFSHLQIFLVISNLKKYSLRFGFTRKMLDIFLCVGYLIVPDIVF